MQTAAELSGFFYGEHETETGRHGADDPMTKPEAIREYIAAMDKTALDWVMIIYGGARHSFTNPDADKAGMDALKYSKSADQRSWKHMKVFFEEIFAK
jgi:dienelactone hydrolase